jgi:hypothetical protein
MKPHVVITKLLYTIFGIFACVSVAQAQITVTEAQIGCIDKPQSKNVGNLTSIVANACNNKFSCSFQAPDPAQYTAEGVHPYTRTFCTQAMEIRYQCVGGGGGSVEVPGDAWKNPPAQLFCEPQAPPQSNTTGSQNPLVPVLQGLLQKYKKCIVEQYESPTPPNPALGPLRDSATCVDGNTCTIASRLATFQKLQIQASRGDPTNFETMLHSAVLNDCFQCGTHAEWHTKQMHCTWDCGGNQNWATDPLHFNAGIGPCFEGCKAGVDVTKSVNDVIDDIHGFLQHALQETGVTGGNQGPATGPGTAPPQGSYTPHKKPFDLVWDMKTGVDANSLPLNPFWGFQIDNRGQVPDFKAYCGAAFTDHERKLDESILAASCTSQSPTLDLPTQDIPCGVGPPFNNMRVLAGHLNWAIGTEVGTLYWSEDSNDGDFNFELMRPDNAAQTALNVGAEYGLHLEFNENETIKDFASPFWVNFYKGMEGLSYSQREAAIASLDGRLAVVTGLIGVDGVHGGYTESHPVFSLAIQTNEQAVQGGIDASWAFFLRNSGGEGCCSSLKHYWYGLKEPNTLGNQTWYFIQLPSPPGATSVSLQAGGTQIWANESGLMGPVISQDSQWTYLGFQLPDPVSGPELDGEVSLHYVFPGRATPPPPSRPKPPALKARIARGDDWEDVRKSIRNPADLKRLDETIRASELAAVKPRPHTVRLPVMASASIPRHQPLVGPGHKGVLTRSTAVADAAGAAARERLDENVRKIIPKEIVPVKRSF